MARPPPEPFYVLRPNAGEVVDLKFITEQNSDIIVYGTTDGVIGLTCLVTKRTVWTYCTSTGKPVIGIDMWNRHHVVSICRGDVAEVLDTATQQQTYQCSVSSPGFCKPCVLQNQETDACEFASGSTDYGKVYLYSTHDKKPCVVLSTDLTKSLGSCMAVQYFVGSSGSGAHVFAGFESGHLVHWDARNPSVVVSSIKLYEEPVMCLQYSTMHNLGVAGSPGKVIKTVHFNEKHDVQLGYEVEVQNAGQCDVSIRHDGRIFATGGWDNRLRVFGCKKGKWLAALEHHTAAVSAVEFYPQPSPSLGNVVAAGSRDERISLWKLY